MHETDYLYSDCAFWIQQLPFMPSERIYFFFSDEKIIISCLFNKFDLAYIQ